MAVPSTGSSEIDVLIGLGIPAAVIAFYRMKDIFRTDGTQTKVNDETKVLIDNLKGERDVAIKERDEAIERADKLQEKLDDERGKNADLRSQVAKLTSDVQYMQQSLDNVMKEFKEIKELYKNVSDALLEARLENANLNGHVTALEKEIGQRAFSEKADPTNGA